MFHSHKKPTMNPHDQRPLCVPGDSGLVLTTDPKPRLRWTVELHDRFIDAVAQLGGPDKATPKTIMRVMGVKGLTLYHLKSHLQKFRLGKQPHKEFHDHSKDALEMQRNAASSSGIMNRTMNENVQITEALRMQKEVQRRLHEQLEVQKHLQMRIEAQGKYMQSIFEKACQTLAGEGGAMAVAGGSFKVPNDQTSAVVNLGASMAFPSFQDLNLFNDERFEIPPHHLHRPLDDFFPSDDSLKKRPNFYINPHGKIPLNDDGCEHPSVFNGGMAADLYEGSSRSTVRRTAVTLPERMSPIIGGGGLSQTRNLSYA